MPAGRERFNPRGWLPAHAVDLVFAGLAASWLWYVLRVTQGFSFWSDDLRLIEQAGSLHGTFEAYNHHLSVVLLASYRFLAGLFGMSFGGYLVFGALAYLAVPVSYYVTTRRAFGPALAAVLAISLLWPEQMVTRPASANHYLALVGAIVAAAALNRGPRADGVLAVAVLFSLASAGGGVVVVAACLVHNILTRSRWRRWLAVGAPLGLWLAWWLLLADAARAHPRAPLETTDAMRVVRDLCLAPFYTVGLHNRVLVPALMAAFLWWGFVQLRHGLRNGANFVAWSVAMLLWAVALVQSRGALADPFTFRYSYLSLGFALLAVVPRKPIGGALAKLTEDARWVGAVAVVLAVALLTAFTARPSLQEFAGRNDELGREAKGTLLVLSLGHEVIPDRARITFFGFDEPHGTARRLRVLVDRYGSPFDATLDSIDGQLVDLGIVRRRPAGQRGHPGCTPLTSPLVQPGIATKGLGVVSSTASMEATPEPLQLWSAEPFTIEVRRFGDDWVRLGEVSAGRTVALTLPALNTDVPWQIRTNGASAVGG